MSAGHSAKLAATAAAGAVGAFLFDPARGRARRARLRDQTRSMLRRDIEAIERRARWQRGRLEGAAHRATHRPHAPENDRVLIDKIRSEVLGRRPGIAHQMSLDACDGRVTLRGEVDDMMAANELAAAVRSVPGVVDVKNLLHGAGQPAPNKAPARQVHV